MPPNTPIFLLGLAVGTCLLLIGLLLGYWFGRKSGGSAEMVDRQQFLIFLRELSTWTSEFSGDVSKYQSQLSSLSKQVQGNGGASSDEILGLLTKIMDANQQLQHRLESAEEKLESQTDQISNYLTEARTDALTGLFNRRAFDKSTDELFAQWQGKNQAFTLGLVDIDHFKQINDTYGHPAGDAVLQRIAAELKAQLPESVCVARYGGEEFAMLSLQPLTDACKSVEALRAAISQVRVEHDGQTISMSMSAGVAQIAGNDRIGNLVRRADEALYAAKLGGRNRIYLHDGSVCRLFTKVNSPAASQEAAAPAPQPKDTLSRVHERLEKIVEEESRRIVKK